MMALSFDFILFFRRKNMDKSTSLGPLNGAFLVGYDFTNGKEKGVLAVGVREWNGTTTIINVFGGAEAEELFKKLAEPKPKDTNDEKETTNALSDM